MSNLSCRNCGDTVVSLEDAKREVQREYNYTDQELETTKAIRVWHPDCAVADRRIDNVAELNGAAYYWEVV